VGGGRVVKADSVVVRWTDVVVPGITDGVVVVETCSVCVDTVVGLTDGAVVVAVGGTTTAVVV
jgi:hypothetical protein